MKRFRHLASDSRRETTLLLSFHGVRRHGNDDSPDDDSGVRPSRPAVSQTGHASASTPAIMLVTSMCIATAPAKANVE
jgi:hypothetical protein